jgi:hypothetical protein
MPDANSPADGWYWFAQFTMGSQRWSEPKANRALRYIGKRLTYQGRAAAPAPISVESVAKSAECAVATVRRLFRRLCEHGLIERRRRVHQPSCYVAVRPNDDDIRLYVKNCPLGEPETRRRVAEALAGFPPSGSTGLQRRAPAMTTDQDAERTPSEPKVNISNPGIVSTERIHTRDGRASSERLGRGDDDVFSDFWSGGHGMIDGRIDDHDASLSYDEILRQSPEHAKEEPEEAVGALVNKLTAVGISHAEATKLVTPENHQIVNAWCDAGRLFMDVFGGGFGPADDGELVPEITHMPGLIVSSIRSQRPGPDLSNYDPQAFRRFLAAANSTWRTWFRTHGNLVFPHTKHWERLVAVANALGHRPVGLIMDWLMSAVDEASTSESPETHSPVKALTYLAQQYDLTAPVAGPTTWSRIQAEPPGDPIATGIRSVDEAREGLHRGELGLILAFTGIGKTMMLAILAAHATLAGKRVAYFSNESRGEQFLVRLVSAIRGSEINEVDNREVTRAQEIVASAGGGVACFAGDWTLVQEQTSVADLLLIDHDDFLASSMDEVPDALKRLRSDLVERGTRAWVAVQASEHCDNRRWEFDPPSIDEEAAPKVEIADLVLGLSQTTMDLRDPDGPWLTLFIRKDALGSKVTARLKAGFGGETSLGVATIQEA